MGVRIQRFTSSSIISIHPRELKPGVRIILRLRSLCTRTYFITITCVIPLVLFIDRELIMHEVIFDNRFASKPEWAFFFLDVVCSSFCYSFSCLFDATCGGIIFIGSYFKELKYGLLRGDILKGSDECANPLRFWTKGYFVTTKEPGFYKDVALYFN